MIKIIEIIEYIITPKNAICAFCIFRSPSPIYQGKIVTIIKYIKRYNFVNFFQLKNTDEEVNLLVIENNNKAGAITKSIFKYLNSKLQLSLFLQI